MIMDEEKRLFSYLLTGEETQFGKIAEKTKTLGGVEDVSLEGAVLKVSLDSHASEYDLFSALSDFASELGVDVDDAEGDEDTEVNETSDSENTEPPVPAEEEEEAAETAPQQPAPSKKVPEEEQRWYKKHLGEYVELAISAILIIISLFLDAEERMVPQLLAAVIVGYEIVWDTFAALFKRRIMYYGIAMTACIVEATLVSSYLAGAIVALVMQGQRVLFGTFADIKLDRIKKCWYFNYTPVSISDDETNDVIFAKDTQIDKEYSFTAGDTVPFDGTVASGTCKADLYNVSLTHKERKFVQGERILAGSVITQGDVKIKAETSPADSVVGKLYSAITAEKKGEAADKAKKQEGVVFAVSLVISLVLCFAAPALFAGESAYAELLPAWACFAAVIFGVSNTFTFSACEDFGWISALNRALSYGIAVCSPDEYRGVANCKTVIFGELGGITEPELSVDKIISVPAYRGKIKELLGGFGMTFRDVLESEERVEYRHDDILVTGSEERLADKGIAVKKAKADGIIRYIALNGEVIGAVSFVVKVKDNAYGALAELKDAGFKTVLIADPSVDLSEFAEIAEVYENKTAEARTNILQEYSAQNENYVYVGLPDSERMADADIVFAPLDGNVAENSALIPGGDVRSAAKAVKLSSRYGRLRKASRWLLTCAKVAAAALGAVLIFACDPLLVWPSVLVDFAAVLVSFAISAVNDFEVI